MFFRRTGGSLAAVALLLFAALLGARAHTIPAPQPAASAAPCRAAAGHLSGSGSVLGVSYLIPDLQRIQRAVSRGTPCYQYYLNPVKVTSHDLPRYGFSGAPLTIVSPPAPHVAPTAHHGEDGLPETDVIVRFRGREYWIVLNQFLRHGPKGIWSIITITAM